MDTNFKELINFIIENLGSTSNIIKVTHSFTKIRFKIKDINLINEYSLRNNVEIFAYQQIDDDVFLMFGSETEEIFNNILLIMDDHKTIEEKTSVFDKITKYMSSIMIPLIGVLLASGVLKTFANLALILGFLSETSSTYIIIYNVGDTFFMFFPLFAAFRSSITFKSSKSIALVIGCVLCTPVLTDLLTMNNEPVILFENTIFEMQTLGTFFGLPLIYPANGYASSVITAIFAVLFASYVERFIKKCIPSILSSFNPLIIIFISLFCTFLFIGPVTYAFNTLIEILFTEIYLFSPIFTCLLLSLIWQPIVLFGLHMPFIFLSMINFTNSGSDYIMAITFTCAFSQLACCIAVFCKSKIKKQKELCIPAMISCLVSITEPAFFDVSLPDKKRFYITMISSCIGSFLIGYYEVLQYNAMAAGLPGFLQFITPDGSFFGVIISCISVTITMIICFILITVTFKEADKYTIENHKSK